LTSLFSLPFLIDFHLFWPPGNDAYVFFFNEISMKVLTDFGQTDWTEGFLEPVSLPTSFDFMSFLQHK